MTDIESDWEGRVAAQWQRVDAIPPEEFVAAIDALAAERREDDAAALFERASARDTVGIESGAEKLYRAALATGRLDSYRASRATIQLASTWRILGKLHESERLLVTELERRENAGGVHALHDELRATLALTYVAQGRAMEAAGLALLTLAPHLTRYNRSMAGNAAELIAKTSAARSRGS
ncbi:MAG TPA: tetratricopeptide repeat protein [Usitatibacter sp.]